MKKEKKAKVKIAILTVMTIGMTITLIGLVAPTIATISFVSIPAAIIFALLAIVLYAGTAYWYVESAKELMGEVSRKPWGLYIVGSMSPMKSFTSKKAAKEALRRFCQITEKPYLAEDMYYISNNGSKRLYKSHAVMKWQGHDPELKEMFYKLKTAKMRIEELNATSTSIVPPYSYQYSPEEQTLYRTIWDMVRFPLIELLYAIKGLVSSILDSGRFFIVLVASLLLAIIFSLAYSVFLTLKKIYNYAKAKVGRIKLRNT